MAAMESSKASPVPLAILGPMLPRSRLVLSSLALVWALGCGTVDSEVYFEPLGEMASAGAQQEAPLSAAGTTSGVAGGTAGSTGALSGSGGVLGSGGAAAGMGGASGSGGNASGGSADEALGCAALQPWQDGPYQLGQRVVSTCKAPYNGACPADETRVFECQPPTGALGLGWCHDRQPGVVNGWDEAWLMHDACPAP
jgi:hypothetical protein